jgi:hypothetical protein
MSFEHWGGGGWTPLPSLRDSVSGMRCVISPRASESTPLPLPATHARPQRGKTTTTCAAPRHTRKEKKRGKSKTVVTTCSCETNSLHHVPTPVHVLPRPIYAYEKSANRQKFEAIGNRSSTLKPWD